MLQSTKFVRIPKDIGYVLNLDNPRNIKMLQYRFKDDAIIYGIRCQINNMIYIGSTMTPRLRFHKHLVTGESSNANLQDAIKEFGLGKFTVHIFEKVDLPFDTSYNEKQVILHKVEQSYLNRFPKRQKYNSINSLAE